MRPPFLLLNLAASLLLSLVAIPTSMGAPSDALCIGKLHVAQKIVHIGGTLTLEGTQFTCRTPNNELFHAAIIVYRPGLGFTIFTAAVAKGGMYSIKVRMPRSLTTAAVLNGAKESLVSTRPGTYYVTIRLSDVYLPPPTGALARFQVVR